MTGYILRRGQLHHADESRYRALEAAGEISIVGAPPSDYLGVPLKTDGHTIGVLAIQNYRPGGRYSEADEQLLTFVADHIATALAKTRAAADLRQRNAELAIVNEVGTALAKQLDLTAVTELIGERLHEVFPDQDLFVALYDAATNTISFPYEFSAGKRVHTEPIIADTGLTAKVIRSTEPLLLRTLQEIKAADAIEIGDTPTRSWMGIPIVVDGSVIGVLAMESDDEYAFDDADLRLVSTLAGTTGVALRNAQLFAETTQRNAELAVINEIGEALAKQLDFQGIIDAVAERITRIFGVESGGISLYDEQSQTLTVPYFVDQGQRFIVDPSPLTGLRKVVIESGRPLRIASEEEAAALGAVFLGVEGETSQSWLGVPIMAGNRVLGVVGLSRYPKNAFTEADERLLSTIASNVGVALENARLFDETKNLLGQTEQRNAELAVINEIGVALASQLDFQGTIDAVGDRSARSSARRTFRSRSSTRPTNMISFPYGSTGEPNSTREPLELGKGLLSIVIRAAAPRASDTRRPVGGRRGRHLAGSGRTSPGWACRSRLGAPCSGRPIAFRRRPKLVQPNLTSGCCQPSRPTWAWRSKTRACLTKPSVCLARRSSAMPSWPSSMRSARRWPSQLDFQGIIDAVGDRIRSIFDVQTRMIILYPTRRRARSRSPTSLDQGEALYPPEPQPRWPRTAEHRHPRRPRLRFGTLEDQ